MSCIDAVMSAVDDLSETEFAEAQALVETAARKMRERADKEETRVAAFAMSVHHRAAIAPCIGGLASTGEMSSPAGQCAAIVGVIGALVAWTPAEAERIGAWMDGNQLYSDCVAAEHAATEYTRCAGYVMGIMDAAAAEENSSNSSGQIAGFRWCVPEDLRLGQMVDVVAKFLHDHPERRYYAAAGLVAHALATAWPCP